MKVSDVGATKGAAAARKGKKVAAKGGEFSDHLAGVTESGEPSEMTEAAAVGGVESILAVQQTPDPTEDRSRGLSRQHGEDILSRLDEIRHAMLIGAIPKERLVQLAQTLRNKRQNSSDPRLEEIIEEIELRAAVEIAKLTIDA